MFLSNVGSLISEFRMEGKKEEGGNMAKYFHRTLVLRFLSSMNNEERRKGRKLMFSSFFMFRLPSSIGRKEDCGKRRFNA